MEWYCALEPLIILNYLCIMYIIWLLPPSREEGGWSRHLGRERGSWGWCLNYTPTCRPLAILRALSPGRRGLVILWSSWLSSVLCESINKLIYYPRCVIDTKFLLKILLSKQLWLLWAFTQAHIWWQHGCGLWPQRTNEDGEIVKFEARTVYKPIFSCSEVRSLIENKYS